MNELGCCLRSSTSEADLNQSHKHMRDESRFVVQRKVNETERRSECLSPSDNDKPDNALVLMLVTARSVVGGCVLRAAKCESCIG